MIDNGQSSEAWYVSAFSRLYPLLYAHRDDGSARREVEGLLGVLDLPGEDALVLDACCGAGRHTSVFAELGYRVVGYDLSPVLLEKAADRKTLTGRLARADMRSLPFDSAFDLVTCLFTSFGYFEDDRENERALEELIRVLKPGGKVVIDHIHKARLEKTLVPRDTCTKNGLEFIQSRRFEGNRIVKEIETFPKKGEGENGERLNLRESVRLYTPSEFEVLLRRYGCNEVSFHGGFAGEPLGPESDRMIVIAAKGGA